MLSVKRTFQNGVARPSEPVGEHEGRLVIIFGRGGEQSFPGCGEGRDVEYALVVGRRLWRGDWYCRSCASARSLPFWQTKESLSGGEDFC